MRRIHLLLFVLYFAIVGLSAQCAAEAQVNGTGTAVAKAPSGPSITLPMREGSLRIAVFGDSGRGSKEQYDLGLVMDE